jgi:MFS superfamily sulfate permease-like transporter
MILHFLKNILAGISALPLLVIMMLGIAIASGISPQNILIPVLIINSLNLLFNKNSILFFSASPSLTILFFQLYQDTQMYNLLIVFVIPSIIFFALSFIKNLNQHISKIPLSPIAGFSLAISVIIIIKQLPQALEIDVTEMKAPEDLLSITSAQSLWTLGIAILIPFIALFFRKKFPNIPLLLFATIIALIICLLIPFRGEIINTHNLFHGFSKEVYVTDLHYIYKNLNMSLWLTLILGLDFIAVFLTIKHFKFDHDPSMKGLLRSWSIGNLISTFLGAVPLGISATTTITIGENKGTNRVAIAAIIVSLVIIILTGPFEFRFPLFVLAGIMFYLGIRIFTIGLRILKESSWIEYIIAILTSLIIIFTDFLIGFSVGLVLGIIHKVITTKKESLVLN